MNVNMNLVWLWHQMRMSIVPYEFQVEYAQRETRSTNLESGHSHCSYRDLWLGLRSLLSWLSFDFWQACNCDYDYIKEAAVALVFDSQ